MLPIIPPMVARACVDGSGPNRSPCGRGRGDVVEDRAGLDDRGPRLGVDREHPVQVPGEVEHEPGADRVAGDRRPAAAAVSGTPARRAHLERRGHLVDVPREGDDLGTTR